MCGIVCVFDLQVESQLLRRKVLKMSKKLRHRGPDWSGIYCGDNAVMSHERLAIVDPISGGQPLFSEDKSLVLAVNGEIYNHEDLRAQCTEYHFQTHSDCEVILALYEKKGISFLDELNGIFAFALYDSANDSYLIARDHMGVVPLYMGWDASGNFYVASELKSLEGVCNKIEVFPPGHYLSSTDGEPKAWYSRDWSDYQAVVNETSNIEELKVALEAAVHRQLMSEYPMVFCCQVAWIPPSYLLSPRNIQRSGLKIMTRSKPGGPVCIHLPLD